ncbi:MerR family transcriptional regulator [Fictibacillus sp. WQ 8-8]|uniref:MerR family transcriptional regulator n=1 Tax=Fictibacillus sp. WQ 8-8 TaxID=2938788 RepID=UPI00210DC785|nr:MerR family transcriptional regulator [Fictibacillus sp. WQ 8-8]MCQ6267141.1 MerR family transcriptional regulator [Fictibacillus sp. WQ 8-8]
MSEYKNVEEVAKTLDIKPSTVKKYYLLFEQHNFRFIRSNQGKLMFSSSDIEMFKKLIKLKNEPGITLSNAVKQLASELKDTKEVLFAIKEIESNMINRFNYIDLKLNNLLNSLALSRGKDSF